MVLIVLIIVGLILHGYAINNYRVLFNMVINVYLLYLSSSFICILAYNDFILINSCL